MVLVIGVVQLLRTFVVVWLAWVSAELSVGLCLYGWCYFGVASVCSYALFLQVFFLALFVCAFCMAGSMMFELSGCVIIQLLGT